MDTKIIAALKKERDEFKNKYLRVLADYSNFEKRVASEKDEISKVAHTQVVLKLLPFLDHLEKAEVFVKDSGLKIVKDDFMKTLLELGLAELDVLGKLFDPHNCEAVEVVAGEKDNIVVDVLRKGYKFQDKIIRVAQVKVSKNIKNSK